mmetsp:Transcript_110836/g.357772  ORF Transcript_110836/g.357772 Transcript_110836/m.357772 type:complete len:254 (+) Transcript_110836:217-978(+)
MRPPWRPSPWARACGMSRPAWRSWRPGPGPPPGLGRRSPSAARGQPLVAAPSSGAPWRAACSAWRSPLALPELQQRSSRSSGQGSSALSATSVSQRRQRRPGCETRCRRPLRTSGDTWMSESVVCAGTSRIAQGPFIALPTRAPLLSSMRLRRRACASRTMRWPRWRARSASLMSSIGMQRPRARGWRSWPSAPRTVWRSSVSTSPACARHWLGPPRLPSSRQCPCRARRPPARWRSSWSGALPRASGTRSCS